jgi:hypothetical protein
MFSRAGLPLWMNLVVSRYPEIFLKRNPVIFGGGFPSEEALPAGDRCNLRYGFEHQPGWAELVEEIAKTATGLFLALRSSGLQPDAFIASRIVREKFGELNFHYDLNLIEPTE